jgi:hypothetical protein
MAEVSSAFAWRIYKPIQIYITIQDIFCIKKNVRFKAWKFQFIASSSILICSCKDDFAFVLTTPYIRFFLPAFMLFFISFLFFLFTRKGVNYIYLFKVHIVLVLNMKFFFCCYNVLLWDFWCVTEQRLKQRQKLHLKSFQNEIFKFIRYMMQNIILHGKTV